MTAKTRKQKQEAAAQTSNSASSQNTGIQRSTSNSPRKWSRRKKRDKSKSPQHPPKVPVQESSTISPESQAPAKKQHKNEDLQTMDTTSPLAKVSFNDQDHIETPPSIQRQVQPPEPQKDSTKFKAKRDLRLTKEPPNHYFYRVIAHTGIEPLKPFTKEDFLNPENDFDLAFLNSYFGDHPKYKDKFRNGELWLPNEDVKFIVGNAVRAEKDPNNVFYPKGQPDMSKAALHATKDRALRVVARMCNTPYSEFPNWNEKKGIHPSGNNMQLLQNDSLAAQGTYLDTPSRPIKPKSPSMLNRPKRMIQTLYQSLQMSTELLRTNNRLDLPELQTSKQLHPLALRKHEVKPMFPL
jgi:hypothetical protein